MIEELTTVRVLVRSEVSKTGETWYVAQCLEYDLATQQRTIKELAQDLFRLLLAHVVVCEKEGLVPFSCLPAAPQPYHDEYETGIGLKIKVERVVPDDAPSLDLLSKFRMPELDFRIADRKPSMKMKAVAASA